MIQEIYCDDEHKNLVQGFIVNFIYCYNEQNFNIDLIEDVQVLIDVNPKRSYNGKIFCLPFILFKYKRNYYVIYYSWFHSYGKDELDVDFIIQKMRNYSIMIKFRVYDKKNKDKLYDLFGCIYP